MKTLFSRSLALVFAALFILFLCVSCADPYPRMSPGKVEEAVRAALFPEVSLLSESGKGELVNYTFLFNQIEGSFTVTSYVYTEKDENGAARTVEELLIYYERDLIDLPSCRSARKELAHAYGVDDTVAEFGQGTIKVNSFSELDRLAQFIEALDCLYSFCEAQPERCVHMSCGAIYVGEVSIVGPEFSHTPNDRLTAEEIAASLKTDYIVMLKRLGLTDETVPEELWQSVSADGARSD